MATEAGTEMETAGVMEMVTAMAMGTATETLSSLNPGAASRAQSRSLGHLCVNGSFVALVRT